MAVTTTTFTDDAQRLRIRYVHVIVGTQGPSDEQSVSQHTQQIWNHQVQQGTIANLFWHPDRMGAVITELGWLSGSGRAEGSGNAVGDNQNLVDTK